MPRSELEDGPMKEAFDAAFELSSLLDTGLDRDTLRILMKLCEQGVNPEALASIVKELRSQYQPKEKGNSSRREST
ncbi:hypothetical protein NDN08_001818 [Rhodosorus marinus]|uniref:Mitotic-spindle organizing protein 1 n=1 Tax=Rhodosorus marinus TaxID=101924 RepID=A0AAV8UUX4_9RHOD|nr:hypothetical protein NDN08_001818 [Rhodosorus marinus]